MDYKKHIAENINLEGVSFEEVYASLTPPQDPAMGDLCLPCFKFAKALKISPLQIAAQIKDNFKKSVYIDGAEAVQGYVNFKFGRAFFIKETVDAILKKGKDFKPYPQNGKTVCIEYSSVNIAKPFHMGHLLATVLGGSLYRIYKFLGYNVVGINHLGDWGTQFGKLICAYKKWGSAEDLEKRGINSLLELYVRFHDESEKDDGSLNDAGRAWFKKIEEGDKEALEIFSKFKEVTLKETSAIYEKLGVEFDSYRGESAYISMLDGIVEELEEKGLLTTSQGAKIVNLEEYKMAPCLILKSDGASLYATRDIAAAKYRKEIYNFDKSLYIVAYQQNLHFQQVFKVLSLMGHSWAEDCIHVPFGMVSLEDGGSLSTRKGNVVFLKDVLATAEKKTLAVIDGKNPGLKNKLEVSKKIGTGAVIFGALSTSRIKDTVFSYAQALNFEGETGPYIQYTHARCCSILEKAEKKSASEPLSPSDCDNLSDDETYDIVKLLSRFDATVFAAAEKYEPSFIARYLVDLAQSFNKFYISHKVLGEKGRLLLTSCVKNTLKNGLKLILLEAPEKM